jgi:hypothetical protein
MRNFGWTRITIIEQKSFLEVVSDFSTEITLRQERDSSEGLRQLTAGVF